MTDSLNCFETLSNSKQYDGITGTDRIYVWCHGKYLFIDIDQKN
jgi:hypothetical protein